MKIKIRIELSKFSIGVLGICFLLPLLCYGVGSGMLGPAFELEPASMTLPESLLNFKIGALLIVGNSMVVLAIASLLFPVLNRYSPHVAMGYLFGRISEALLLLAGLIATLSFVYVVQNSLAADSGVLAGLEQAKWLAQGFNHYAFQVSMLILGLGSLPVFYLFYVQKLIPRILSVWGVAGYGLLLTGAVAELLGYQIGLMLSIPGGLFELSFAVWLVMAAFTVNNNETSPSVG